MESYSTSGYGTTGLRRCHKQALTSGTRRRESLDRSYALFGSDQLAAGQRAALTVRLTAARLSADDGLFRNTLAAVQAMRGTRGWTNHTDASINREQAEWHRRHNHLDAAARFNELVVTASSNEPVHLAGLPKITGT